MRHRRLTGAVLLLGACLLPAAGKLLGQYAESPTAPVQREVIATSEPVTPQTAAVAPPQLMPPAPSAPIARAAGSPNTPAVAAPIAGAIQQVSFVPEPRVASPGGTGVSPVEATPMLPPTALLHGLRTNALTASQPLTPTTPTAAALSVQVMGPDQLLMGKSLAYEIVLRNNGGRPVAELHVEQPLPAGTRAGKTEPRALVRDNRLVWDLRNLEAGDERHLKVELNLLRAGDLDLRPYVTFLCGDGLRTKVTRPPFSVEMSADHDKAPRGGRIRFTIRLANHGDAPVENIKLYDTLPSGLHHPRGPKLGLELGNLLPGETRSLTLETTAVESGPFRNEVLAQADCGVEGRAALDVVISEPSLSLRLEGPAQTVTQHEAEFHLEAANPGSLSAKNVTLVQALPPTLDVVSASRGASLDSTRHALVWSLPDLTCGQRQTVSFRVKANLAGDWPMTAAVLSQNLPEAHHTTHTLHAEATAELKLEVRSREERLSVGQETIFRMHVLNKGDAPCTGLRLTAVLPEAVTPLDAQGPSAGTIETQRVSFAPLAQLDAHGDAVYRIHVRGRQVGGGSLRVELTAEKQMPAQSEISIQVHEATTGETSVPATSSATAGTTKSAAGETLR